MRSKTFAQHLDQLLKPLESGTRFNIYDVKTQSTRSELFQDRKSTLQHHLILVTGIKTKNNDADDNDNTNEQNQQLVCGIEADEYETLLDNGELERTLYIGKVDTTGTREFKGVINRVIQAYIKSTSPCTVHVFARSQPQYLFHLSARNKDKQVLSDRNLIRWWYKVLAACLEQHQQHKEEEEKEETSNEKLGLFGSWWKWITSSNGNANNEQTTPRTIILKQDTGWLSIPSIDDERSAWYEIGEKPDLSLWRYGLPYDPDARAAKVMPRFEDDAKARLLKTFEGQNDDDTNMSVKDFWAMLGITEECGHHLTGFFVVKLDGGKNIDKNDVDDVSKEIKREKYTVFWNYFMDLNFENEKNNKDSTKKFVAKWKSMNLNEPLIVNTNGPAYSVEKNTNIATISTSAVPSSSVSTSGPKQVNVLSTSSIKRRPTSNTNTIPTASASGPKQVNLLSASSIKRRVVTSTHTTANTTSSSSTSTSEPKQVNVLPTSSIKRRPVTNTKVQNNVTNTTSPSSTSTSEPKQVNVLPTSSIKRRPVTNTKVHDNITNNNVTTPSSCTSNPENEVSDTFTTPLPPNLGRRQRSQMDDTEKSSSDQVKKARIL